MRTVFVLKSSNRNVLRVIKWLFTVFFFDEAGGENSSVLPNVTWPILLKVLYVPTIFKT